MRGRKRTPTAINKLRGNPGKRSRKNEPNPKSARGHKPPKHYEKIERDYWNRRVEELTTINVLSVIDLGLLEAECDAYMDYVRAHAIVKREGEILTFVGSTGHETTKKHPAVDVANAAWKRWLEALRETGSTPSARSKVSQVEEEEEGTAKLLAFDGGKK